MSDQQRVSQFLVPDLLGPRLRIFCGTAPSNTSAAERAYYAYKHNKFWPTLFAIGLTPRLFLPTEYGQLLPLGIGLTDLCKTDKGNDPQLPKSALDVARVKNEILKLHRKFLHS